ncbi:MAG: Tetratricopeptide repeat-containing protein [Verrucomicrobiales bacterium]|nr:Tetratricopeptide repeat-containing protein [Verrucomicrobiales bacterium]
MPSDFTPRSPFESGFEDDTTFKPKPIYGTGGVDQTVLQSIRMEIEGYLELDMADCAEEELSKLPSYVQRQPLMLDAWLALLMQTRRWEEALATGLQGCKAAPLNPAFFIHSAFCLHELGHTGEAHRLLSTGPESLLKEALYHYNTACYLAVLGRPREAAPHLAQAFQLDPGLRQFAETDRDLKFLWPKLPEL